MDRNFWAAKLQVTKKAWRGCRPECTTRGGRVTKVGFDFPSTLTFTADVKVAFFVSGFKFDDSAWSLRVRIALYDKRVAALRSIAMGFDTAAYFLDFDVLAASSFIAREEFPISPRIPIETADRAIVPYLRDYSNRTDSIWGIVGGFSIENFEKLAVWIIRNRTAVGSQIDGLGIISAAFVYGENELGHTLLTEYSSGWERRLRTEPSDAVLDVYSNARASIQRLREAISARTVH